MIQELLVGVCLASTLLQLIFWGIFLPRLFKESPPVNSGLPAVSVLICARNAHQYLQKHLQDFLTQDYPAFEVIVVDDGSTDGTISFLQELSRQIPKLKILSIVKQNEGKKTALMHGIRIAQFEWILLTDADCRPAGKDWIRYWMQSVSVDTEIVLGYAPYEKTKGFFNRWMRLECCINAQQMFAAVLWGKPYTAVGRNMLVRKSLYHEVKVLRPEIAFGDDDLFIQHYRKNKNIGICTHPASFSISPPATGYGEYFRRKQRHYAASRYYSQESLFYLFLYHFSFAAWMLTSLGLSFTFAPWTGLLCGLTRVVVSSWVFCKNARKLEEADLCSLFPLYEGLYLFHLIAQIPGWLRKTRKWKHG